MSDSMQWKVIGCFVLIMFSSLSADALEIRVKRECRFTGSLVRLGDVADVLDDDAERASAVAQIALFPAPSQSRFVTSQELQRLVQLNGISLAECRFTGSKSARVTVAAATSARPSGRQTPTVGTVRRSQKRLESAIVNYLKQTADPAAEWEVRVTATRRQLQLVSNELDDLAISGGREPWLGRQRFVVTF
ncbi:MAG: hypothetical protein IH991_11915, partial [Planctomycetes bacterium]|nr:hypothetical protein [Planctomycetota bacterium]